MTDNSHPLQSPPAERRLEGVDALRGTAALLVVLFHYTSRYEELFAHTSPLVISVPWGHLGVNLFFMISGFVIFMTLERTRRPAEFLVSRFSRLFPVYWVCLGITFLVIVLFPQLGISVSLLQAVGNMLMFHGFLGIADIDGVYWTLEVELIFYTLMFLIWLSGGLKKPVRVIVIWLVACILAAAAVKLGKPLPYVVTRILLLKYFAYFSLGLLMYLFYRSREFAWSREGVAGALAFMAIGIADGMNYAAWTVGFLLLFWYAIFSWRSSLVTRAMTRLGIISYPIYLLHENIGWTLIHGLERTGVNAHLAVIAAFVVILALSAVLHVTVEKPAQQAIRAWYGARTATTVAPTRAVRMSWTVGTLLFTAAVLIANRLSLQP